MCVCGGGANQDGSSVRYGPRGGGGREGRFNQSKRSGAVDEVDGERHGSTAAEQRHRGRKATLDTQVDALAGASIIKRMHVRGIGHTQLPFPCHALPVQRLSRGRGGAGMRSGAAEDCHERGCGVAAVGVGGWVGGREFIGNEIPMAMLMRGDARRETIVFYK
jgi:hypothetical protein